jgi:hypothetical protein
LRFLVDRYPGKNGPVGEALTAGILGVKSAAGIHKIKPGAAKPPVLYLQVVELRGVEPLAS